MPGRSKKTKRKNKVPRSSKRDKTKSGGSAQAKPSKGGHDSKQASKGDEKGSGSKKADNAGSSKSSDSPPKATKKPTCVVLVRHGLTETTGQVLPGRTAGLHLSGEGQDQAARLGMRLSSLQVAAVYASPLERTKETAAPIAKACGVRTRTGPGLVECDFGSWTGKSLKDLRKLPEWKTVQHNPSQFRFPDGESFGEMQQRIWDQITTLVDHHRGQTIVAVSHADPIKAAVAMACGTPLDLFQRFVISTCSASLLWFTADGPVVMAVNSNGDSLAEMKLA